MTPQEQAYWVGFETKCAELGVDAEELIKLAQLSIPMAALRALLKKIGHGKGIAQLRKSVGGPTVHDRARIDALRNVLSPGAERNIGLGGGARKLPSVTEINPFNLRM